MLRVRLRGLRGPVIKSLVFVVVTSLATGVLAITIANRGGGESAIYTARFVDATSLNPGDDVRMAGVRIGQVESVEVAGRSHANVEFSVAADRRLYPSTTATIKFRNLIGQRYVSLDHNGAASGAPLPDGASIPLERTRPALDLTALFNGFKPLFKALSPEQVNKLSYQIVQVLQGEGGTVDDLLEHTASLTSGLAEKDQIIGQVVQNLNVVLDKMNARGPKITKLISTSRQLVSGLARDAKPFGEAIDGLAALSTSASDLLRQGREPLRRDIDALGELSETLADNTPAFERFIGNLPRKYTAIGRMASYGSWFNFYLCGVKSDAPPAPGGPPVGIPVTASRCKR